MRAHVIQSGEDLSSIASRLGCEPDEIWSHPDNHDLREQRGGSGQVLSPGDVLYVPEPAIRSYHLNAETTNSYAFEVPMMTVQVTMQTMTGVLRNEPCIIEGPATPIETQTDGDGKLSIEVPNTIRNLQVHFPNHNMITDLFVGRLDPVDTESGVLQRLENLGYLFPLDESSYPNDQPEVTSAEHRRHRVREALRAYQRDHQLDPSGAADDATRASLAEGHGV